MDHLLDQLNQSITQARTLEELTRPLLELLEEITGLESTYLTVIDLPRGVQSILFARNTRQMQIPEGLSVPWNDTLCKRALDEGRAFTDDVAACWGDSQAAAALGIQTYASTAVRLADGQLYGTLCAASAERHALAAPARHALALFARLIAQQIEREQLVRQLLEANARLAAHAGTDPLTGLPNRRALHEALRQQLALGAREGRTVMVAFLDLDGFKAINDVHGHDAGDALLVAVADGLRQALRAGDVAARYGGDEFVVAGPGPQAGDAVESARQAFAQRMAEATRGGFACAGVHIDYAGASVGAIAVPPGALDAHAALQQADQAMYAAKRARRG